MKVKTLIRFTDIKENIIREVGDEFEVTNKRLEEILLANLQPLVMETKSVEPKKATKKNKK